MKKIILFFSLLWVFNCEAQGTWSNLDGGIQQGAGIFTICPDTINNILYVGGAFDSVASFSQIAFTKWDGTKWDSTAYFSNNNFGVNALIMYKGVLYVGFSNGKVGIYDKDTLTYIPGFSDAVFCFAIYKDTLFAGGKFFICNYFDSTQSSAYNIAKWDGAKWESVSGGMKWESCCSSVDAMTVYNDQLIAGGVFDTAGNVVARGMASYDGNKWSAMGGGINNSYPGTVLSLNVYKNKLYIGGSLSDLDLITTEGIAVWNGSTWDSLSQSPSSPIYALKSFDGYLFMGGRIGKDRQFIWKYNGQILSPVDSGVSGNVYSLASWNGSLYAGGGFDSAGGIVMAKSIARWTLDTTTAIKRLNVNSVQITIFPDPFSEETTIQFSQQITNNTQLTLYDLTGRKVENYFIASGAKSFVIKRNNLPAGMYFVVVKDEDGSMLGRTKIVVQ